ncbi:GFO_IDH_MocA domain-containing protein, partial [Haematococcus lacustris]
MMRLRELVLGKPQPGLSDSSSPSPLPGWQQPAASPGGSQGVLGRLQHLDVQLLIPEWMFGGPQGDNIRFQDQLAGGAMMDGGCYCISLLRLLTGAEPYVVSAEASLVPGSQVTDGAMTAQLAWSDVPGLTASFTASLQHPGPVPLTQLKVQGA